MQVRDVMTPSAHLAAPNETIAHAAELMARHDIGFLPVGENDRLVGTITDRDIAVRAVAKGLDPQTPVSEIMTRDIRYCFDDDDVSDIARDFADQQVRRMPVVNRDKRLVGVVSLGDLAIDHELDAQSIQALGGISRPGGHHSQTGDSQF